ncbi:AAA-type ATPase family protein [Dorcoceras hygrometricum]|uniref:AAA-type ATPase family protein n=1 Tax=Dorcoceras hygrometricum TaxID=472368 RepID=A0A2Z7B2R4_9LAMI|nr:AAA-type ATPase family protein [Dorcoceras hygrometricum]
MSTTGEQEATTEIRPELEKPTSDESIGCGREGLVRTTADQEERIAGIDSNAEGHEERIECATQTGQGEIEEWVENVDGTKQDTSSNPSAMETDINKGVIVVRSGPEQPAQPSLTFTGTGIFTPIDIQDIIWVTYFLPKIDPSTKGKETLVVFSKSTPVEEQCQLVLNSAWDDVSARMYAFDEWVHFRKVDEQEKATARKADQPDEQIEMADPIVEMVEDIVHENFNTMSGGQALEQPALEVEDQPQNSPAHSSSRRGSRSSASHLSMHSSQSACMRFYSNSNPSSSESPTSSDSLPIHTKDHVNNLANNEDSSHDDSQQVFVSSPPATLHADIKLEVVGKVVASLDSRMSSLDSKVQSIDSRVKSMNSKVGSLYSKVEALLNIQTFMKHNFGIYKRAFYDNMDTMAASVTSSHTSLETSLVHQLAEHQFQLASDLDFVKLQLAELFNHLKEIGDAKKGGRRTKPCV